MAKSTARKGRRRNWKRKTGKVTKKIETAEISSAEIQTNTGDISEDESCGRNGGKDDPVAESCSTPKGKGHRIPEILSCPPAPKKRRRHPNFSSNRSPISFFAHPDIELFFFGIP